MTETPTGTPLEISPLPPIEADGLLQLLISYSELGIETPITLLAGGMTVSGVIISAANYMENTGAQLSAALRNHDAQLAETVAQSFAQLTQDVEAQSRKADEAGTLSARFIHLKNAKYFIPGQDGLPNNTDGIFWRGRLNSISGFSLGSFTAR
jgi:hypothetical protein